MPGIKELAKSNLEALRQNPYPGRGIIQGVSNTGDFAQVYWVMGRSPNSRNRIMHQPDSQTVATVPFDAGKVEDPSLIIYNAMRTVSPELGEDYHIVTNGNQTDRVASDIMEEAVVAEDEEGFLLTSLYSQTQEPDAPNYTPRISGLYVPRESKYQFLKTAKNPLDTTDSLEDSVHSLYDYQEGLAGYGHTIHTYNGDGDPLPTFDRDPYILPLSGGVDDIAESFWDVLNKANRVAIAVKTINYQQDRVNVRIINALGG